MTAATTKKTNVHEVGTTKPIATCQWSKPHPLYRMCRTASMLLDCEKSPLIAWSTLGIVSTGQMTP